MSQRLDPYRVGAAGFSLTVIGEARLPALSCQPAAPRQGSRGDRHHIPAIIQGSRMRIKFEAVDKNGKLHKRAGVSRVYSHCVVIHFAAHPPSRSWPKGVTAYSRAQWAVSRALAERSASRWRKEPYVQAIEILEAREV
jgi:hypothetical protein